MKKILIVICLTASALSLHARAIQEDYRSAEEKSKVSYAFGMLIGGNLISTDLEFDYPSFTNGVMAALEKMETQFTEQEAIEIVETALYAAMERRAEINRQEEFQFLVTNGQREEIQTTASGLQYEILSEGDGERPGPNSVVRVNYIGTFTDGTPFDSSYEDEGALIPMGLVIPGWAEGLSLMPVGSKYRFFVPSSLAYGKDGIQSIIPPYSTLIFVVDLLEIVSEDMADFNP